MRRRGAARRTAWKRLAILLCGAMGATPTAKAVAEPPRADRPPTFRTEAALVALPVFVSNPHGDPIPGLTAADFSVKDNGRPVTIVGFAEVDAGAGPAGRATAGTSDDVAGPASWRQFLLLFDLSFSPVQGILRARRAALEFLDRGFGPRDLVAVATMSTKTGFEWLVGFTPDVSQARRAVASLGLLHTEARVDPLRIYYDLGAPQEGLATEGIEDWLQAQAKMLVRRERVQYNQRVVSYLESLRRMGEALDSVQGRKQVVLFSGGFDQSTLLGAVAEGKAADPFFGGVSDWGDPRASRSLEEAVRAAAASDTVIHTVDVGGLAAGVDVTLATGPTVGNEQGGTRTDRGREALAAIAADSHGIFVKDDNDIAGALRRLVDASRLYYVLAFRPSEEKPGKFHKLEVKVATKDARVSHRAGYVPAPSEDASASEARRLQASEAIAKGESGGAIDLDLTAVPYREADGRLTAPVVLHVDGRSLLGDGKRDAVKLELYAYAFDSGGAVEDVTDLAATLEVKKVGARLRQGGLLVETALAIGEGSHDIRVLVRDGETGRTGSRRIRVEAPGFGPGRLVLYPPMLMEDPREAVLLTVPSRKVAVPDMPFRVGDEVFAPAGWPSLERGKAVRLCLMAFTGSLDPTSTFEIASHLLAEDGAAVHLGEVSLGRAVMEKDGFRRYVLDVVPAAVAPGRYTLRVRLKDPRSGAVAEADRSVRIE